MKVKKLKNKYSKILGKDYRNYPYVIDTYCFFDNLTKVILKRK